MIINGGAFMGFGDVRISEINHNGKIISVEASKECFDILNLPEHNLYFCNVFFHFTSNNYAS